MTKNARAEREVRHWATYARKRKAVLAGNAVREDARAAARRAADAVDAPEKSRGGRIDALDSLGRLGETLAQLQSEEQRLRAQRDELIDPPRAAGASWNSLALRTKLGRQVLVKRRGVTGVAGRA